MMDVDLAALRAIERDKDISEEYLIKTLEDALLNAYNKTPHALRGVKVEVNRKTGKVSVLAPEFNDDDEVIGYFDDTPDDFGRIAAATARQVIFQRLREAEDDQKFGHFSGTEGDIIVGTIQQDRDTRAVRVDLGTLEAMMPLAEQVPGEDYSHGRRLRVYVVAVRVVLVGLDVDLVGLLDQPRRLLEVLQLGFLGEIHDGADDLAVKGVVEVVAEVAQGFFQPLAGVVEQVVADGDAARVRPGGNLQILESGQQLHRPFRLIGWHLGETDFAVLDAAVLGHDGGMTRVGNAMGQLTRALRSHGLTLAGVILSA